MKTSESIKQIAPAVVTVQANLKMALKESTNPHFKSKFANLESVWDACRGQLQEAELAVIQTFSVVEGKSCLDTVLLHTSGEWIMGTQLLNEIKQDPQATASASTYARRYGLAAILGIIQTDDDGESAMGRTTQAPPDIERKIQEAGQAVAKVKSLPEAMDVWTKLVNPVYPYMDPKLQQEFNAAKERIKKEFK